MGVAAPVDKRKLLADSSLLRHLSAAELDKLAAYARIERHPVGTLIFEKGSAGSSMMAVIAGRVKISVLSPDGKEVVLNVINPGEVFGEIALLDGKERTADATALGDCELLVLDRRDFVPFLERHPEVSLRLLAVLCERLRRTSEQVEDISFRDLPSRLAKVLLRLADSYGKPGSGSITIGLKLSQRELGNMIGISRESINKQLREWETARIVRFDRNGIAITDSDALRTLADPL